MKIASVWNPKGGQGKSMLCINLAAAAVELGLIPVVICQDPQGTSMLYYEGGNLPFKVIPEPPKKRINADLILFDHQASELEIPGSHLLVMPTMPARDQYATWANAYERAKSSGKRIVKVVTNCNYSRKEEAEIAKTLKQTGAFEVKASGVFSKAANNYYSIFEPKLNRAYKIKERRQEINGLLAAILQED
jgi:chromosome partitioning protein